MNPTHVKKDRWLGVNHINVPVVEFRETGTNVRGKCLEPDALLRIDSSKRKILKCFCVFIDDLDGVSVDSLAFVGS